MTHLLRGAALAVLIAAAAPALAAKPAPAGTPIIPPADPAAAKTATSPPAAPAAPPAAAVTATSIRHDRPMRHRIAWHRRHARRHYWQHHLRSDRVAEQLNLEELRRMMPPAMPRRAPH